MQRYSEFISFPIYLLTEKEVEKEVGALSLLLNKSFPVPELFVPPRPAVTFLIRS